VDALTGSNYLRAADFQLTPSLLEGETTAGYPIGGGLLPGQRADSVDVSTTG
jgi:hypothetical protein